MRINKKVAFVGYNVLLTAILITGYHFISAYVNQKNIIDDYKVATIFSVEE